MPSLHRKHLHQLSTHHHDSITYNYQTLHRTSVFVSIIPSNLSRLENVFSIYNTWASTVTNMAIFISNYTNNSLLLTDHSFVTELRADTYYPSLNEIIQVLQYLYDHYSRNYEYFLIVSDNAYVNMYSFEDVINQVVVEDEELVYAGFSKSFGLHKYCRADSGVLLSVRTLSRVIENINNCIGWSKRYSWDVMLGQCLRKTLGIKCMNISQVRNDGREREREGGRERERVRRERE